MKKKIAAAILAAGVATVAFAGTAAADPFEGHFESCTGQHDGTYCWDNTYGVVQHLNMLY